MLSASKRLLACFTKIAVIFLDKREAALSRMKLSYTSTTLIATLGIGSHPLCILASCLQASQSKPYQSFPFSTICNRAKAYDCLLHNLSICIFSTIQSYYSDRYLHAHNPLNTSLKLQVPKRITMLYNVI